MIKDDDKLGWKQTNKHKAKVRHCNNSLHGFTTQANGTKHLRKGCMVEVGQRLEMPKEHEKMKFSHHFKEEKFPFGDFLLILNAWQFQDTKSLIMEQILIFTGQSPLSLSSRLRFTNSIPLVVLWWTQWIQLKILQNNTCTVARKVWIISVWN